MGLKHLKHYEGHSCEVLFSIKWEELFWISQRAFEPPVVISKKFIVFKLKHENFMTNSVKRFWYVNKDNQCKTYFSKLLSLWSKNWIMVCTVTSNFLKLGRMEIGHHYHHLQFRISILSIHGKFLSVKKYQKYAWFVQPIKTIFNNIKTTVIITSGFFMYFRKNAL